MPLIVQESLRGLLYAPFYAAFSLGAYRREGLDVQFASAPNPAAAPDALFAGSVDVSWGGPMRVNQMYETRPDCDLVCFGEAVTRDPFLLLGRTPRPHFALGDLMKVRVATVSEVPTPWLCLQEDLRRAGFDPAALDRVADRSMPDNMAALRRSEIEVVQLFEPFAEALIAAGEGHIWYAAARRGPTAYTSFYARRGVLAERRGDLVKLLRGLYATQQWLHRAAPEAIAEAVAGYFPDVPSSLLRGGIARYRELGIWRRDPIMPREGYERLLAGLISSGFVRGTPFAVAVDNSLAEEVVRNPPAPM